VITTIAIVIVVIEVQAILVIARNRGAGAGSDSGAGSMLDQHGPLWICRPPLTTPSTIVNDLLTVRKSLGGDGRKNDCTSSGSCCTSPGSLVGAGLRSRGSDLVVDGPSVSASSSYSSLSAC